MASDGEHSNASSGGWDSSKEERPRLSGIVVGDDGSDPSSAAVRWAAEEAQLRSLPLHVVRAWTMTTAVRPRDWSPGFVPSMQEFRDATSGALSDSLEPLRAKHPGLDLHCHAIHGSAGAVLVELSKQADLLVTGHEGHGGLRERFLGSVAEDVVRRAQCSVLIARS